MEVSDQLNPLSPELNLICYLLALLAHDFLHVARIRVKSLILRLLMSYIYIYDISNLRVNDATVLAPKISLLIISSKRLETGRFPEPVRVYRIREKSLAVSGIIPLSFHCPIYNLVAR
jgi:hypothetical protein